MDNTSILRHLREREINDSINRSLQRKWHVSESLIKRLGHEKDLEGHEGCVNCLEWNSEGQILASASDDFQVILWNPFTYKKLQTIETGHHGNIFSVKFLPYSNDRILVTGAGDCQLLVHDVNERGPISICTCPMGRVKRLATSPNVPHIFWSAAEDGVIRQYDVRSPHYCSEGEPNVLVYLRSHLGGNAEAKCVAINPCRSELMAVGANDPYVRLYDRRMIKLTCMRTPTVPQNPPPPRNNGEITGSSRYTSLLTDVVMEVADNLSAGCVQYFVPGHLPIRNQYHKNKCMPATYVTFGPDGTDLLVNLGGEQIYLYDISRNSLPKSFNLPKYALPEVYGGCGKPLSNGRLQHAESAASKKHLPQDVEFLKSFANRQFDRGEYSKAIRLYNTTILMFPEGPILYANRAAAYMKRNWKGDMYAALRDCHTALAIDPNHVKAFFRLARCLYELDWREEAKQCLEAFKIRFPGDADCHACKALQQDIVTPRSPTLKNKNSSRQPTTDLPPDLEFSDDDDDVELVAQNVITNQESAWREKAFDYKKRYYGHCNTTTDIKEANFFGSNGQYIMAGSDDGSIFFWERETTNNVRILRGDSSIVNCIQPHPSCCLLASSGIDSSVRLWSPKPEDGKVNDRVVGDIDDAAVMNQRRMKADPFDVVMRDMRSRLINQISQIEGAGEDALRTYNCRTS